MSNPTTPSTSDENPFAAADEHIRTAPLPMKRTLRRRSSLFVQLWRFALINVKIVKMVTKGHH